MILTQRVISTHGVLTAHEEPPYGWGHALITPVSFIISIRFAGEQRWMVDVRMVYTNERGVILDHLMQEIECRSPKSTFRHFEDYLSVYEGIRIESFAY